jgi:hypothetical protein
VDYFFEVTPSQDDMTKLTTWVYEGRELGGRYAGMSYEDGIMVVLDWLEGNSPRPDLDV